ncbi:DeoR family transcriptional regulator [Salipaludibacillus neizhouensis]|uniref:DeoR family transcriptional regulator n=1 Tax=Salipaludibacillus neizhouensis TaxID=885475 RepID=A0A3A9K4G4_9BACI|nr:DeoR/GlpR family DNA-binding transcription regulator [Salipaludibacillus neizhouensis]RKL66218.1 DeoR family transcriptional regulator [Salipaludibacillus neizhouensis]
MLVAERHQKIVETLLEQGSIRVTELSKTYGFTEETIRRDLEKLEKEGKLLRTHGGAVPLAQNSGDLPYFKRETIHVEEKMQVASEALKMIEEKHRIIMDSSSTAFYLAKILPNMPLTVVTCSMRITYELSKKDQINVINTGGTLSTNTLSFVGPLTLDALDQFHVDIAFMSCKGIDHEWGISDSNDMEAAVKKKMIEVASKKVLLLDGSKIGRRSFSKVGPVEDFDAIIVDRLADKTIQKALENKKIKVITIND